MGKDYSMSTRCLWMHEYSEFISREFIPQNKHIISR